MHPATRTEHSCDHFRLLHDSGLRNGVFGADEKQFLARQGWRRPGRNQCLASLHTEMHTSMHDDTERVSSCRPTTILPVRFVFSASRHGRSGMAHAICAGGHKGRSPLFRGTRKTHPTRQGSSSSLTGFGSNAAEQPQGSCQLAQSFTLGHEDGTSANGTNAIRPAQCGVRHSSLRERKISKPDQDAEIHSCRRPKPRLVLRKLSPCLYLLFQSVSALQASMFAGARSSFWDFVFLSECLHISSFF